VDTERIMPVGRNAVKSLGKYLGISRCLEGVQSSVCFSMAPRATYLKKSQSAVFMLPEKGVPSAVVETLTKDDKN